MAADNGQKVHRAGKVTDIGKGKDTKSFLVKTKVHVLSGTCRAFQNQLMISSEVPLYFVWVLTFHMNPHIEVYKVRIMAYYNV